LHASPGHSSRSRAAPIRRWSAVPGSGNSGSGAIAARSATSSGRGKLLWPAGSSAAVLAGVVTPFAGVTSFRDRGLRPRGGTISLLIVAVHPWHVGREKVWRADACGLCFGPLIAGICQNSDTPSLPGSGSFPRSALSLMIVFGGGCLNVRSEVRMSRLQPIDRGHRHHRPGRDNHRRCQYRRPGFAYSVKPSFSPCPTRSWCRRSRCNAG
jgi:hypothetical protein